MSATAMAGGERIGWGVMAVLSVGVAGYAIFHAATGFRFLGLTNPMLSPWGLQTHIAASGFAMLTGPFQFLPGLRRKQPAIHRWIGRIYVAACLVGGLAGATIALSSTAGLVAGWGFFMLAVLWLIFTSLALAAALRRDFVAHRRWMIRSFALTLGAVTLRLYLPIGVMTVGFGVSYPIIAWLAWVPNLLAAELWIRRRAGRRMPAASAAT